MTNPYSIKTEQYQGRSLVGTSMNPAYDKDEAYALYNKQVAYWEGQVKTAGDAIKITLVCNDPGYIVEEKTVRGEEVNQ